jgi:alginate O-acetyltransferase complex protein AlgI
MLFHSAVFLFAFLPVTFAIFLAASRLDRRGARWLWLVIASLVFYAYFSPPLTLLLMASMAFNYGCSRMIGAAARLARRRVAQALLIFAIATNLTILGVFKYADFAIANVNAVLGTGFGLLHLVLPLAISFYTFQQIAYLVNVSRDPAASVSPLEYLFFTTFFPHLIAGPICYSSDIVPQMHKDPGREQFWLDVQVGAVAFLIGLSKKVVLASEFQTVADAAFAQAAPGSTTAWLGVLAYSLQIYFDFSAYSDMAIGLGLMFGIRLPLNFYSPYKAASVIEFWRCWHITLSRFLRDYVYFPLGGGRRGAGRRGTNLMIVMLLAGLWHGAGWTFVLWGAIHGAMLLVNHGWRNASRGLVVPRPAAVLVTFILVSLAWIPFRSADLAQATHFFAALWQPLALRDVVRMLDDAALVAAGLAICFLLPNTYQLLEPFRPTCTAPPANAAFGYGVFDKRLAWMRFGPGWAAVLAVLAFAILRGSLDRGADRFIYFQF